MKKFLSFFSPAPQRIRIENRLEQESILRIGIGIRIVKIQTMPNPTFNVQFLLQVSRAERCCTSRVHEGVSLHILVALF